MGLQKYGLNSQKLQTLQWIPKNTTQSTHSSLLFKSANPKEG